LAVIGKKDKKKLIYRLLVVAQLDLKFSICDEDEWYLIGDQYAFELNYQFINELDFATILISLDEGVLDEDYYLKFVRKINNKRDFDETTIIKWHFKKPERVYVICKEDIFDNGDSTSRFTKKCKYEGMKILNIGYVLIGEPYPWDEEADQSVNGKVIDLFQVSQHDHYFKDHFFFTDILESNQDAWKRHEKDQHIKRFDL